MPTGPNAARKGRWVVLNAQRPTDQPRRKKPDPSLDGSARDQLVRRVAACHHRPHPHLIREVSLSGPTARTSQPRHPPRPRRCTHWTRTTARSPAPENIGLCPDHTGRLGPPTTGLVGVRRSWVHRTTLAQLAPTRRWISVHRATLDMRDRRKLVGWSEEFRAKIQFSKQGVLNAMVSLVVEEDPDHPPPASGSPM